MRKFTIFIGLLLVSGCTISDQGITPFWMVKKSVPVVVQPRNITSHEFRCLVVENGPREKLSVAQSGMITHKNFRDFLKANCVEDGFRFVDITNGNNLTGVWKEMFDKAGDVKQFPIVIFQNGPHYLAKPLPPTWEQLQVDAEKYAGVTQ